VLPVLLRLPPVVEALDSVVGGGVSTADLAVSPLLVVDAVVDGDETASDASASLAEQR